MKTLGRLDGFLGGHMAPVVLCCVALGIAFPEVLSHLNGVTVGLFAFMTFSNSLGGGFRVRDAGAQQIQLARPFIFTDQMGDKGFHRAALHSRNRQLRRRNQQNARFARCIRRAQRQNGQPLFSLV